MIRSIGVAFVAALLALPAAAEPRVVKLWHSYNDAEASALQHSIDLFQQQHPEIRVEALSAPYEGYASKLTTAIPNDNGPDVFIFAHERLGGWAQAGIVMPLDKLVDASVWSEFFPETIAPLSYRSLRYGLPLAFKSTALFYNKDLVPTPPTTTDELLKVAESLSGNGRFGLAYQADNFYYHAAWYIGFGEEPLDREGIAHFDSPGSIASLRFVQQLSLKGILPSEPTGSLISRLFNDGNAAMVINGPWFVGELKPSLHYGVAPMPRISATGRPASPLLTDEAVFISGRTKAVEDALLLARFLAGQQSAVIRAVEGRQVVANRLAWNDPRLASDPFLGAFRAQLATTTPTDNRPEMQNVWEPGILGLKKVLRGEATPEQAAQAAQRRYAIIAKPTPPPANPKPYVFLGIVLILSAIGLMVRWVVRTVRGGEGRNAALGWSWAGPGMIATLALIFVPFAVGLVLSLFSHKNGEFTFVGLANFTDIITSKGFGFTEPLSFYYALIVTVAWTAVNLALHVGIGLGLALVLNRPLLKLKGIYRVLLIIPWAVPNYITALLWKGMFHKQFGAINGMLEWLGFKGISWFSSFGTAFFANVCTNAWLPVHDGRLPGGAPVDSAGLVRGGRRRWRFELGQVPAHHGADAAAGAGAGDPAGHGLDVQSVQRGLSRLRR
jgi:arabinogalactan oligomer/maltooligosaccharide transport system permease protein